MKASKFTESPIAFVLKQGEEDTLVADVCRKAGISQATYFNNWKKKFGGLLPSEVKRLRQLEEGNGRLKRIVAGLSLDKGMLRGTSSAESYEAWPPAAVGRSFAGNLAGQHSPRLRRTSH